MVWKSNTNETDLQETFFFFFFPFNAMNFEKLRENSSEGAMGEKWFIILSFYKTLNFSIFNICL